MNERGRVSFVATASFYSASAFMSKANKVEWFILVTSVSPLRILHYAADYPQFFALQSQCRVTFATVGGAIVLFSRIKLESLNVE